MLNKKQFWIKAAALSGVFVSAILVSRFAFAQFTGPSGSAGSGSGAISADSNRNVGVGGSSASGVKLNVIASTSDTTTYGLKVLNQSGTPIIAARGDGYVGVGTSSPTYPLSVQGTIQAAGGSFIGTLAASNLSSGVFASGNFAFPSSLGVATSSQVGLPQTFTVYGGTYNTGIGINSGDVVGAGITLNNYSASGRKFDIISTGASASPGAGTFAIYDETAGGLAGYRFVINSSGNVGIATTTPSSPLTVAGVVYSSTGGFKFPDGTTQTTAGASGGIGSGWTISGTNVILATSTNNVGIGGTPAQKLSITKDLATITTEADWAFSTQSDATVQLLIGTQAAGGFGAIQSFDPATSWATKPLALQPNGGNVNIGTTASPLAKLNILATSEATFTGAGSTVLYLNSDDTDLQWRGITFGRGGNPVGKIAVKRTVNGTFMSLGTSNNYGTGVTNEALTIDYSGNVGVGTGSGAALSNKLTVSGNMGATGWVGAGCEVACESSGGYGLMYATGQLDLQNSSGRYVALKPRTMTYTSLEVDGSNGGYSGITFNAASTTGGYPSLMVNNTLNYQGFYKEGTGWSWLFQDGILTIGGVNTPSSVTGGEVYTNNWFRNNLTATGLYNSVTGAHWYSTGGTAGLATYYNLNISGAAGTGAGGIVFKAGYEGANKGYIYSDGSNFGMLNNAGSWGFYMPNGTTSLTVAGPVVTIGAGTGKINVGTVDPIYTIGGKKYATYLPAMTGQKEETTGIISLKNQKAEIVFKNLAEGSDLWLFAKATNLVNNFDALVVLLTPGFDGKVWYEKDIARKKLIIHGSSSGEVSYRLTAPRFDAQKLPNRLDYETTEGFNLDRLLRNE